MKGADASNRDAGRDVSLGSHNPSTENTSPELRIMGTQSIKVDVRVIAATNRDLQAAVANGTFRHSTRSPDRLRTARNATWVSGESSDRKSTRLNSSHRCISYAVFCLN